MIKAIHIAIISLLFIGYSCKSSHFINAPYSSDPNYLLQKSGKEIHHIKQDDKLTISVWDNDNLSVGSVFSIYNSNESYGKWILVDSSGTVNLPKIGSIKIKNMTLIELQDTLTKIYATVLVKPIVVAKILNREASILGEVNKPGNYLIEKENTTLIELIGKAEGTTDFSNLKKVQVVRSDTSYILNLEEQKNYYALQLHSNDIVFLPSKKKKSLVKNAPTIIPFASAITAIGVLLTVFLK